MPRLGAFVAVLLVVVGATCSSGGFSDDVEDAATRIERLVEVAEVLDDYLAAAAAGGSLGALEGAARSACQELLEVYEGPTGTRRDPHESSRVPGLWPRPYVDLSEQARVTCAILGTRPTLRLPDGATERLANVMVDHPEDLARLQRLATDDPEAADRLRASLIDAMRRSTLEEAEELRAMLAAPLEGVRELDYSPAQLRRVLAERE